MTAAIVAEIQACIDRGETAAAIDHAREALKHASGVERAQLLLTLAGACTSRGEVSVSIGVAQATETVDLAGLLALADKRLYAAKYAGRDRVVTV